MEELNDNTTKGSAAVGLIRRAIIDRDFVCELCKAELFLDTTVVWMAMGFMEGVACGACYDDHYSDERYLGRTDGRKLKHDDEAMTFIREENFGYLMESDAV
ncbi:MAG: hypothetical protein HQL86_09135 [Magnetococcales bacterium]|nr:hypothetical protein [Magnetococcales bacterium]